MNDHHLILGILKDFLTGEDIPDTLDERYRQDIARRLFMDGRFAKNEIVKDFRLTVRASEKTAIVKIDFIVRMNDMELMLIKYGPGSIITRHRPALAAARLVAPHQIPWVIVTNGEQADILSGKTGAVLNQGLNCIPTREEVVDHTAQEPLEGIDTKRFTLESRILYAFEVDGSCPCDTDICRIDP